MGKLVVLFLATQLFISSVFADDRKTADVNNKDFSNQTALHDAVRIKNFKMVEFLVQSKIQIDTKDQFGYTPLHLAVRYSDLNTTNFLIENKSNIDTVDIYGETPLVDAVRSNNAEISKSLICAGAKRDIVDQYDITPIHYATKNKNLYLLKLLTQEYVELYCQNNIEISINEDKSEDEIKRVCGKIDVGYASFMSLSLSNEDLDEFGPYKVDIDNKNHTWCSNITEKLAKGNYTLMAKANDYVINEAVAESKRFTSSPIKIMINTMDENIYSYTPQICGKIKYAFATKVELSVSPENNESIVLGTYEAVVDNENRTWCADVSDTLSEGTYIFNALGEDEKGNISKDIAIASVKSPIAIAIDPIPEYNDNPPKVCGRVLRGDIATLDLNITSIDEITYGPYEAQIDSDTQTWCADITETLQAGEYNFNALGKDEKGNTSKDMTTGIVKSALAIDIDKTPVFNDNTPEICGRVLRGDITKVDLNITSNDGTVFGPYVAKIDQENQTWCADITDEMQNGDFVIDATGYDENENKAMDKETTKIYRIVGLYEALKEEFKDDFEAWSAELDKDTLTFRFKDPTLLFNPGRSDIKEKFQAILSDFFPRYVKIVEEYKLEIEKVRIEGHSSSEHSRATSDAQRFELNRQLSQKRAESVASNAKASQSKIIETNKQWVETTFEPEGMSHSKLVYNLDGTENKELSRRVEFRIVTKPLNDTPMIDGELQ